MSENWKRFELHTAQQGETTCIALLGEFDLIGLDQLEQELHATDCEPGRAVLDLRGLRFIDPAGSIDDVGRDLVA